MTQILLRGTACLLKGGGVAAGVALGHALNRIGMRSNAELQVAC